MNWRDSVPTVVGTDLSEAMLAEARRRNAGVDFRLEDLQRLSFPDNSFDAVTITPCTVQFPFEFFRNTMAGMTCRPRDGTRWLKPRRPAGSSRR